MKGNQEETRIVSTGGWWMLMRNRKYRYFSQLPRRKQREAFIRLRWKINRDSLSRSRGFYSPHILEEGGELAGQWADAFFLGLDGRTIWNATVETVEMAQRSISQDMAFDEAERRLTPEEYDEATRIEWRPVVHHGQRVHQVVSREPVVYDKLGGLSWHGFIRKEEERIFQTNPPKVPESFTRKFDYRYGIGLIMVVNEPVITSVEIKRAIARFRELGERDWKGEPQ